MKKYLDIEKIVIPLQSVSINFVFFLLKHLYRGVEQLVARRAHNPEVIGSSPFPATKTKVNISVDLFYYMLIFYL
jgi:hypothetical protein